MLDTLDLTALDGFLGIYPPAAPRGAMSSPLGSLVARPAVRCRNGVAYLSARSWRAGTKDADLADLKRWKARRAPEEISAAAGEVAVFLRELIGGWPGVVSNIACGHSRCEDCWGKQLARETARLLEAPFVKLFEDRFVSGSSHPKEFDRLPPLQWREQPDRPVLVVDDLATSGWHMEEALTLIRAVGQPAMGIAWIAGSVTG